MKKDFRIVWSVDPFAQTPSVQRSAVKALLAFTATQPAEIFPIHVLAAGIPEKLRAFSEDSLQKLRTVGKRKLAAIIGRAKLKTEPLHILPRKFSSVRGGAEELLRFSKKVKADLIVLTTRANSAPKRWVLGSFAETLSNLSDLPVLIAPPNWKTGAGAKRVLFATDFSKASFHAFERLLEEAAPRGWSVTLFNHVDYQFYPAYAFAFAALGTYEDDVKVVVAERQKQAKVFIERAARAGVKLEVLIRSTQTLNVANTIAKEARNGYLFVALASESSFIRNALVMGGTTRQLIRSSTIPTWVIHPILKEKGARISQRIAAEADRESAELSHLLL